MPGDEILTHGHGVQTLRWIGRTRLDAQVLDARPEVRPVASAGGLWAAPATRIRLTGAEVSLHFGFESALAPIGDLDGPGVLTAFPAGLTCFTLLFERHVLVRAGSQWCESLFLDAKAAARHALTSPAPPADIRHAKTALPCLADWESRLLRHLRARRGTDARPEAA